MASPPQTTVVGTYVTESEGEEARERLTAAGIESVEMTKLSSDVWQVEVPSRHREQALRELQLMEQHNIADL